jgi:hypothetical protein
MDDLVRKIAHFKNKQFKSDLQQLLHQATSNENWSVSTIILDKLA